VNGVLPQAASGFPGATPVTEYISIAESRWRQQLAGARPPARRRNADPVARRRRAAPYLWTSLASPLGSRTDYQGARYPPQCRKSQERKIAAFAMRGGRGQPVPVSPMPRWVFCASSRRRAASGRVHVTPAPAREPVHRPQLHRCHPASTPLEHRIRWRLAPPPPGRQPPLRPASILSPSSRMMAALGAEPQLRVQRNSSGRTRRRSSISCCGSHGSSSTRAQNRVW
jgi:hypothetical protein